MDKNWHTLKQDLARDNDFIYTMIYLYEKVKSKYLLLSRAVLIASAVFHNPAEFGTNLMTVTFLSLCLKADTLNLANDTTQTNVFFWNFSNNLHQF